MVELSKLLISLKSCTLCPSKLCPAPWVPCNRKEDPCKFLSFQKFVRNRETACVILEKKKNVFINVFKNRQI